MKIRLGMTALRLIKKAFLVKSQGGTDECGLKWPPLSPKTIAYSRRHFGVLFPGKKRAPFAPSWMLTDKQRKRWWDIYRSLLGTAPKGAAFHKHKASGSDANAARTAWKILKAEGAKTLLSEYGETKVFILRSTELLLNSLSPGVSPGDVKNQVFRLGNGEVIVGTNREWAKVHHEGTAKIPQRRLWAAPSQWPATWWGDIAEQGRAGLIDIFLSYLRTS